jgi:hypothetical protein
MSAMIKIDVVRKAVDSHPLKRLAGGVALADRRKLRALGLDPGVAIHANFGSRYGGECGLIHGGVAIEAVQAQVSGVQFVTVWNGLHWRISRLENGGEGQVSGEAGAANDDQPEDNGPEPDIFVG